MGPTGKIRSRHAHEDIPIREVEVAHGRAMITFLNPSYRLSPLHATRVGEASHPGPVSDSTELTILVTNPTSLHQKVDIMSSYEATILMLSETSATSLAQSQFARSFRSKGYSTVWGQPAPRQQHREGAEDGLRGAPTGVSVHAKFPIRPSNLNRATDWYLSGRILHCFLQVGQMTIQLVTVYGIPSCHPGSRADTNALLEEAISFVRQANYPWIIAGDLNHHPSQLPAFESLRAAGCSTAAQIFEQQEGSEIPHTFKTATRNDIAILAPELASHVTKVWVDQQKWLLGHNPLLFKLRCPNEVPSLSYWPLPSSWLMFDVDSQAIARHFEQITTPIIDSDPLHQWSKKVELAVDMAMQERAARSPEQYPQTHLPRKCRGRCDNFQVKTVPHTRLIKPAWHNQYTPDVDQPSLQLRQQTRQLRRLQSLRARLNKLPTGTFTEELGLEWKAILRADGFGTRFLHWLKHRSDLAQVPMFIPSVPYLERVISEVHSVVTSGVTQHAAKRKQFAQYLREADIQRYHKKDAYSELREPSPGLLVQARVERTFGYRRLTEPQHGLCQVQLQEASELELHLPCTIVGSSEEDALQIVSVADNVVEFMLRNADMPIPTEGQIQQTQITMNPQDVASQLDQYWGQFWRRDTEHSLRHEEDWGLFFNLLDRVEPLEPMDIDLLDVNLWQDAIKSLRSGTARGACGWHADELKTLPIQCIQQLAQAFNEVVPGSFPPHLMRARVIALKKTVDADRAKMTRPITILSLLYRLWSRATTRAILLRWSQTFPAAVTGFLPGRSVQCFQYAFQHSLEQAQLHSHEPQIGGLTVDLTKAFNLLPRKPCKALLEKLGVPPPLIATWFESLNALRRHWQLGDQLIQGELATTGAPEGDSWSVCCMLSINKMLCDLLSNHMIHLHLYADNWSYWTMTPEEHVPTVQCLIDATQALSLVVDWSKSWCWATSPPHKQAFESLTTRLPDIPQIQHVNHAKDLGQTLHYRCQQYRQPQQERHAQTLQRLWKLRKTRHSLQVKGQLIQMSCLPKALHGTHLYAAGEVWFKELRTGISQALVGQHKNTQPYLANTILTDTIVDPEYYVIKHAVLAARDFLFHSTSQVVHNFLFMVSRPHRNPGQIVGPAQALSFYLSKLAWQVDSTGNIHTQEISPLHILDSPISNIVETLEHAWMLHVGIQISHRQGMRHSPCIDRQATVQELQRQPEQSQHALAIQMVGAWMTNQQKTHFAEGADGNCHLCGQQDSVPHQILECPATEVIRQQHPEATSFLQDHDQIYQFLPVIFLDAHFDFIRCIQSKMPVPLPRAPAFIPECFFTDGTCLFPTDSRHRRAGFSILAPKGSLATIADLQTFDLDTLNRYFDTIALGHQRGSQTVDRSELDAAVTAHEMELGSPVITDSQYVIDAEKLIRATPTLQMLHKKSHYDLLKRWHFLVWDLQLATPTQKIKAHQPLTGRAGHERALRVGNHFADMAVKHGVKNLHREYQALLNQMAAEFEYSQRQYRQQLQLRSDLAAFRKQLEKSKPEAILNRHTANQRRLLNWTCPDGHQFALPEEEIAAICNASRYGVKYTERLLRWLQQLRWPTADDPEQTDPGITWIELVFNFWLVAQQVILLPFARVDGTWYLDFQQVQGWTCDQTNFEDMIHQFQQSIQHLESLTRERILPKRTRQLIGSLYQLGSGTFKRGFLRRPDLPEATLTVQLVQDYVQSNLHNGKTTFTSLPVIPEKPPLVFSVFEEPMGDNPTARHQRFQLRRASLRERRSSAALSS
eukprot:Skav226362  [mRNA]  locus=scaffold290:35852:41140:- [translate_table: standard]